MKAAIGLGNPGGAYARTRHNAGFWVVDRLAAKIGVNVSKKASHALVAVGKWQGEPLLLAKPATYMNNSGKAVRALADQYRIPPENLLVIYDDLDLEPGVLRLRAKGSAGGHNGVRSVIHYLGTQEFPRLKVGIGSVLEGWSGADYVLAEPAPKERPHLDSAVAAAVDAVLCWVVDGVDAAMSRFNRSWKAH